MQWLELTIETCSEGIALLEAALTMNGFDSFISEDAEEFEVFLQTNRDYWDVVDSALSETMRSLSRVRLYLADAPDAMEEIQRLRQLSVDLKRQYPDAALGSLELHIANVKDEDWENNWKQYYRPIPIGKRLLVVPQWLKPETGDRLPILLDPGMIFGTGAHASTQMCMCALEELIRGGETVLDLGSGSGILSITALLLGASHATGVDVDPKAEDIARENAAINGIGSDRFLALTGNVLQGGDTLSGVFSKRYDVICMNIFADVIIPMAAVLPRFLKPDTVIVGSGVLAPRMPDVENALNEAGLRVVSVRQEQDWCCFTAREAER